MQQGNFIHVFLARHVSDIYAHHQEHQMLSWSIRFSAPSFWMGGSLESRCVGRVYGADGVARHHLMLLMMGVCTRNMSSWEYINKITLLHHVGISNYFMRKMHGETTLKLYLRLCRISVRASYRYWILLRPKLVYIIHQDSVRLSYRTQYAAVGRTSVNAE